MPSPDDLNLARQVVDEGVCQPSEVQECLDIQRKSEQVGTLQSLAVLLLEKGFATQTQLSRLKLPQPAAAAAAEANTMRLGHYELLLKLGEGGMGAVYKANDTRNGKIVAIKVLPRSKAKDELFLKRFEMEARATFELDHPNIVHGYDVGHSDGYHYLVIEFVQGYDLCALLEQRGRFTETEALNILEQMSKALDHIHTEHLVHRDIKPENILVGEDGVAKLTDMGLTVDDPVKGRRRRLTQAGIAMGTPFYLSPEQIKGESDVDIRSDIYALGGTTYEMVTGRPPFEGDTPAIVMMKHLNEHVPSPHDLDRTISINFCHLLERMMAKDPFHRYQTPYEMLQDVRRVMRGKQPMGIRPPAGRSSVARPEMHQESRRLEPIVDWDRPQDDSPPDGAENGLRPDAPAHKPSSTILPNVSRTADGKSPSSNVLPAVDHPERAWQKPPSSKPPHGGNAGTKQPAAPAMQAVARSNPAKKATKSMPGVSMPLWLRFFIIITLLAIGAYALYDHVLNEKNTPRVPVDPLQQKDPHKPQ